jgi:hypothetical protein
LILRGSQPRDLFRNAPQPQFGERDAQIERQCRGEVDGARH